jgi:hypothetical protein
MRSKGQRKSDIHKIDTEIEELLKSFRIEDKFKETELVVSWEKIMGSTIARRTQRIFIKDRKLFIKLSSAPLKNELSMSKSKILSLFFQEMGEAVVDDIIFI